MPTTLAIDLLRIDCDTQNRVAINEDTVSDYADTIIANGTKWPFPPLDVFHDGSDYFVADGFHRLLAAQRAKRGSIPCNLHKGTAKDARIFGMTANDRHGLRMSPEDKRACVEWLLDHGGKLTQKEIAEKAGVGVRLVKKVIAERNPASIAGKAAPPKRDGKGHRAPSTPNRGVNGQGLGSTTGSEPVEEFTASDTDGTEEGTEAAGGDLPSDRCPSCNLVRWQAVDEGFQCGNCGHWHGEPVAEDEPEDARWTDEAKKMRAKLRKTLEAGQRAVDDLQAEIRDNERHRLILAAIGDCMEFTKEWASV